MCINCNIPFPLTEETLRILRIPKHSEAECMMMSTRDMIEFLAMLIRQYPADIRNEWMKEVLRNLKIEAFCDPTSIEIDTDDIKWFLGLSDLSRVFTVHLKECNFTNQAQYDIKVLQTFENSEATGACQVKSGFFNRKREDIEPRKMPEGYPLEQLCYHTILSKAAILLYSSEVTTEQLSDWSGMITMSKKMLNEKSPRDIWRAISSKNNNIQMVSGVITTRADK